MLRKLPPVSTKIKSPNNDVGKLGGAQLRDEVTNKTKSSYKINTRSFCKFSKYDHKINTLKQQEIHSGKYIESHC